MTHSSFSLREVPMAQIIQTAEPFFFPGQGKNSRTGCLVTHGFTGAPKEMRWLGEYLNKDGYTVCGVRLAGHATRPEDMIRSRYSDWLLSVEDGYNLLHSCMEKIFLLGLSMGGTLSLITASLFPVSGVVAMSTPYKLPDDPRLKYAKILSKIRPYMPKGKNLPGSDWFDKASFAQHVAYPENPVRCVGELNELMGVMRDCLPQVNVPVLLIYSRDDHYIYQGSMDSIHERLGSQDKQKLWVEGGGHVITEEPTRTVVFKAAADFIKRVSDAL
jgi:carboxylesterase